MDVVVSFVIIIGFNLSIDVIIIIRFGELRYRKKLLINWSNFQKIYQQRKLNQLREKIKVFQIEKIPEN